MPFVPQTPVSHTPSQTLHVVTMISNPMAYSSRYRLYERFAERMKRHNCLLHTIEVAYGQRAHEVTDSKNPDHIQLRTPHNLWHKENALNIAISRLPPEAQYIAWVDADVEFQRTDIVEATIHALQHYPVVQMFGQAIDLGPTGDMIPGGVHYGFAHQYVKHGIDKMVESEISGRYGENVRLRTSPTIEFPHSGFAWAARRELLDATGGLLDRSILGAGDHHAAWSFLGYAEQMACPQGLHPNYMQMLKNYQDSAVKVVRGHLGYVPGTLTHEFHGKKSDRRYTSRWQILQNHQFDPYYDVVPDTTGLLRFRGNKPEMERDIHKYMAARNEDSIDLE